jgi:predicted  nucleic acid-binding Zn-ribbon protein
VDEPTTVHWLRTLAGFQEQQERARHAARRAAQRRDDLAELLAEAEADVAAADDDTDKRRQLRALESEVADLRSRLARLQAQRNQVRDDKALQSLGREITGIEEIIDTRETEILQELENTEGRQQERESRQAQLAEERRHIAREREDLQQVQERAASEATEFAREIAVCLGQLPPKVLANVKRLGEHLPLPVAYLDGEACGGCHALFPPQRARDIEKGLAMVRCQTCGRYVVSKS